MGVQKGGAAEVWEAEAAGNAAAAGEDSADGHGERGGVKAATEGKQVMTLKAVRLRQLPLQVHAQGHQFAREPDLQQLPGGRVRAIDPPARSALRATLRLLFDLWREAAG